MLAEWLFILSLFFTSGDSFTCEIPPESMNVYLKLIKDEVIKSASKLGNRIAGSLNNKEEGAE